MERAWEGFKAYVESSVAAVRSESIGDAIGRVLQGLGPEFGAASAAIGAIGRLGSSSALATKAINLPAWRKVGIDMGHVVERHTAGGPLAAGRTTFPTMMSERGIERAIREAYRYGQRVGGEGDRILMQGTSRGLTIEMWVNRGTRMIETAYPVVR